MRLRATVVSFATMNLWLPTIKVAQYLAGEFLDYDPSVHFPIHNIVSGTSTFDGLMVYDPVKQGLDHDGSGAFIRRWVPELRMLEGSQVHDFTRTSGCFSADAQNAGLEPYPVPIVDYRQTGRRAKQRVSDIRKGRIETAPDHEQLTLL